MGSNAKQRTTMAKLQRENRLREKRMEKQARKDARKRAAANDRVDPTRPAPASYSASAGGAPGPGRAAR